MASTYVNDLRIEEQATGENSGTWGTKVNSAFSQIAEAFSYGTKQLAADSNETFTMPDGTSDGTRSLYLKITSAGSLTATRTVTLGPNTVSKLWIIENATTGSQSITIAQGSGGTVTIPTGAVKMVYSDGAGSGAAVVDALTDVYLASVDHAAFGDNKKAIFGAGSDLQIYHDGTNSYIVDSGDGYLLIRGAAQVRLSNADGSQNYFVGVDSAQVELTYSGSKKFETTSTGIDVTGTVTADGLTVEKAGSSAVVADFSSTGANAYLQINDSNSTTFAGLGVTTDSLSLWSLNKKRVNIDSGGDISFYEDTGTTAKLFWDASAESLGIGTSSPGNILKIFNTADSDGVNVENTNASFSNSGLFINNTASTGGNLLRLRSSGSDKVVVLGTGNVGIGETSPAEKLEVAGNILLNASNAEINLRSGVTGTTGAINWTFNTDSTDFTSIKLSYDDRNTNGLHIDSGYPIKIDASGIGTIFAQSGSEKARIDSSGNLLVGKTATNFATTGVQLFAGGFLHATASQATAGSGNVVSFSRNTTDGDIAIFAKDGSPVGSIGSRSGVVSYIVLDPRSGVKGAALIGGSIDANNGVINPGKADGDIADDAITFGTPSSRFKDLYLSGGAYLGGTGSANYLDDYEEGTWTPVYEGSTTAGTGTYTRQSGVYVKVGDLVYASCTIGISAHTGSGNAEVTGLPFSALNNTGNYAGISVSFNNGHTTTSGYQIIGFVQVATAAIRLYETGGTGQQNALALDTAFTEFDFSIVYRAA